MSNNKGSWDAVYRVVLAESQDKETQTSHVEMHQLFHVTPCTEQLAAPAVLLLSFL